MPALQKVLEVRGGKAEEGRMKGTIRTFDAADGLGWIDLDDGREVRFGLTACKGLVPAAGHTVRVGGLYEAFGRLKATSVEPVLEKYDVEERVWPEVLQEFSVEQRWENGVQADVRVRRVLFDREGWHRASPEWAAPSELAELVRPSPVGPRPKNPPAHPFFAPWHDSLCRAAVQALRLIPADDDRRETPSSTIGGDTATLSAPWPECGKKGHGPMTLLVSVAPEDFEALQPSSALRLSVHACVPCLKKKHHAWLGKPEAVASVNLSHASNGNRIAGQAKAQISEVRLRSEVVLSFPRSWVFQPRRDVEGHEPVAGVARELFRVGLVRGTGGAPSNPYQDAGQAYDSHYGAPADGLFVGGFSVFRFALCPCCHHPMRQAFHLNDYFTDDQFAGLFDGSNELTLLACDRTTQCGGIPKGLLVLDP
jgi:hypothetical protein